MTEEQNAIIEAEADDAPLAVQDERSITLGGGSTSLPSVEEQGALLVEFDKRRKHFFQWLDEHFTEGVHYGTPPGCEPRSADSKQWRSKPSLYDSGARLFIDIFGLRPTYEADLGSWRMLGEQAGSFCRKCKLLNKNGEVVGEGSGVFLVNEKKMNANSALKMAEKRARVSAVLDGIPFARELWTQDLEDMGSPLEKLKEWITASRVDFEAELSTDDFLAEVAEACLFGKRTITTNAEANRIQDALARGDFDLQTGTRVKAAQSPQEPQDAPESTTATPPDPQRPNDVTGFMARVAKKRKGESSLPDVEFVAAVLEAEFGPETAVLADLTHEQFVQVGKALAGRKYDWATAEELPPADKQG